MKNLTLTTICLILAGCTTVGPDFKAPATPAAPAFAHWNSVGAGGEQAFARFSDPVLAQLQRQALEANHDLKSSALRFAQSRLQRKVTASAQGPQVQARAGAVQQRQSESGSATRMLGIVAPANSEALAGALAEPFTAYQAGFDASWELDLWGRVKRMVEAADANAAEAAATLQQVQMGVAIEVARNYYELRLVQGQMQLAQADIAAGEQLLVLAGARNRGGLVSDTDVLREQASLSAQRASLPLLQEQEARAMNQLALLTASLPGSLEARLAATAAAVDAPFGSTPDLSLGITSDVLTRRPDIAIAQARLHAATAGIGIATAELYPRITLGATLGSESLSVGRFGDWGSRQWSVGPSLTLPLFDQGRRRATVQLRELQQQEEAVHYQKTVLGAWTEVDNALSGYAAERLRRAQWQQREVASHKALELAEVRFKQGMSDYVKVLDARRALLLAQRDRLQSEASLTQRLLVICKAAGISPQF